MSSAQHSPRYAAAHEYVALGLSVVPIAVDGSKAPVVQWMEYQSRLPTDGELYGWFGYAGYGLAVVTGAVSGHLTCVDCDSKPVADRFEGRLRATAPGMIDRLVTVESPRGRHYYHRSAHHSPPSTVLAADHTAEKKTLIDLKGAGGLVIAPPSGGRVHPTGLSYTFATARTFADLRTLTRDEEIAVYIAALECDRRPLSPPRPNRPAAPARAGLVRRLLGRSTGGRPGDRFGEQTDWAEVLEPHGWTLACETADGVRHWTRPGKDRGTSATTGYDPDGRDCDLLHVFTAAAPPFEQGHAYSKFAAHALLEHAGDFRAAARAVARAAVYIPRSLRPL